jgi:CRISPR-associated protein Cas2
MQTLVVYDIPSDRARTKIADACQDYGLDRIQYSAFLGNLERTHQEELLIKIGKQLGKRAGKVHLFTMCEKDWRLRLEIIQEGKADEDKQNGDGGTSVGDGDGRQTA